MQVLPFLMGILHLTYGFLQVRFQVVDRIKKGGNIKERRRDVKEGVKRKWRKDV